MKAEYKRTGYPSDLTDEQWEKIEGFFPSGNKSKHHKRNLVEAVMYVVKTGCQWRALPHDYPPYSTVYNFYSRAKKKGTWEKVMQFLVKETRMKAGKDEEPTRGRLKYSIISELIFQNKSNLNLRFFLSDGVLNIPFRGLAAIVGLLKILNIWLHLKKISSLFLMPICSSNGYENKFLAEYKTIFVELIVLVGGVTIWQEDYDGSVLP